LRVEGVRVVKVGRLGEGAELRVRDLDREAAEVGGGCVVPRTPDAGCRVVPQDHLYVAQVLVGLATDTTVYLSRQGEALKVNKLTCTIRASDFSLHTCGDCVGMSYRNTHNSCTWFLKFTTQTDVY
jgi:hypothetical protein